MMIKKWIRYNSLGKIDLVSEVERFDLQEIELNITEQEYKNGFLSDILDGKYMYENGEFKANPNYVDLSEIDIEKERQKRDWGQKIIFQFQSEVGIEGIFNQNPLLAQQLILQTENLKDALESGWLLMADRIIENYPAENINEIITAELLLRYRNLIRSYMELKEVKSYNEVAVNPEKSTVQNIMSRIKFW